MSDLSARARRVAVRDGLIPANPIGSQGQLNVLNEIYGALYRVGKSLLIGKTAASSDWADVLFAVATLSAMSGTDIVDGVQSAIEQREITGKPKVPGTLAPVPNAKDNDGTLRDPAGPMGISD